MTLSVLCIEYLTIEINQEVEAEKSGVQVLNYIAAPRPTWASGLREKKPPEGSGDISEEKAERMLRMESRKKAVECCLLDLTEPRQSGFHGV